MKLNKHSLGALFDLAGSGLGSRAFLLASNGLQEFRNSREPGYDVSGRTERELVELLSKGRLEEAFAHRDRAVLRGGVHLIGLTHSSINHSLDNFERYPAGSALGYAVLFSLSHPDAEFGSLVDDLVGYLWRLNRRATIAAFPSASSDAAVPWHRLLAEACMELDGFGKEGSGCPWSVGVSNSLHAIARSIEVDYPTLFQPDPESLLLELLGSACLVEERAVCRAGGKSRPGRMPSL